MPDYPEAFDRMLAAWNETDREKIRDYLDAALTPDVHFVDPTVDIKGIEAFETMIHGVQARIPNAVYSRISDVDNHHNLYRYHWAIHRNGEMLVQGFDVAATDDDGRISMVLGFFGNLPIQDGNQII